jgi:N-acyl-D-amino-acid deacylase
MYISHMRSEGNALLEAIDELITIAREAGVPAEIYHLKAAGRENWDEDGHGDRAIEAAARRRPAHHDRHVHLHRRRDRPRRAMPPWVQEGGLQEWRAAAGPGDPRPRAARDAHADRRVGEPLPARGLPSGCCSSRSGRTR